MNHHSIFRHQQEQTTWQRDDLKLAA